MLHVSVPGWRNLHLGHLVLDVNGTLARDGLLLPGVVDRLAALRSTLDVRLLTADTHGRLDEIARDLGVPGTRLRAGEPEAAQKGEYVRQLGPATVVAIGNGANDVAMLREAALSIVVLGPEGLAIDAVWVAHLLVASIGDALDLLLNPKRLVATLRR